MLRKFLLLCIWLGTIPAGAEVLSSEPVSVSNAQETATDRALGGLSAQSGLATEFQINQKSYVDDGQPYFRDGAAGADTSFLLRSTSGDRFKGKTFGGKWDLEDEYSSAERWNYVRPREAYVTLGPFSLGRKKLQYSNWEDEWGQSLFEPRFMDDKLRNSKAGLTGLFYEKEAKYYHFRAAYLPVYIPEMGPHYWMGDNGFQSRNPWFQSPPTTYPLNGVPTQIDYSLNQPSYNDVVFHQGAMAQIEWKPSPSTFSRFSYAYKPMNQILMAFPMDHPFRLPNTIDVTIQPRFLYHHVANYDFTYQREQNEFGLSIAGEKPIKDNLPGDWEAQNLTDALIASGYYTWMIDQAKSWSFHTSVLKVWGGDLPDQGSNEFLFEGRYQYTEAISAGLRKQWRARTWPGIDSGVRVIYDRLQNGLVYSGDVTAQLRKALALSASFDVFDLLPGTPQIQNGFIYTYRGNDRISLGMSYVF